jgi:hypothetical protein
MKRAETFYVVCAQLDSRGVGEAREHHGGPFNSGTGLPVVQVARVCKAEHVTEFVNENGQVVALFEPERMGHVQEHIRLENGHAAVG